MSILRLFSQKEPAELISGNTVKVAEPVEGQPANEVPINSGANEEAKNQDAVKADSDDRYITIKWGTGEPIDVIYNFIHKNLEDKGYNDALVNSNISYLNGEIDIINDDLKMLFRRIALRYKELCTEIDVNIEAAEAAFLSTTVAELNARKRIYTEHLDEIKEMEGMLENEDPRVQNMVKTYRRGFSRGIAAKTAAFINNNTITNTYSHD